MVLATLHGLPRDVSTQIAAYLTARDLRNLTHTCQGIRRTVFCEIALKNSLLKLPPNDAVVQKLIEALGERAASCVFQVSIADAKHLALLVKCVHINKLRVSGDGYTRDYEPIQELRYLDQFPLLRCLNLSGSTILGVASLCGLTALHELDLSSTLVADISPLHRLAKLQVLNLERTRVSSIAVVSHMPALRIVDLSHTSTLHDISPLFTLKKLERLSINDTALVEVDTLLSLAPSLISLDAIQVAFPGGHVTPQVRQDALTALSHLEHLAMWPLSWTQSLDPLRSMVKMKTLDLRFPPFTDLAPLQLLTEVEDLQLMISATRDTSPLRALTKLKRLLLTGCPTDAHALDFLNELPALRDLSLSGVIHPSVITRLVCLESLELNYASASWDRIPSTDRLPRSMVAALVNVTRLSLRFPVGDPADLSVLDCMTQLEHLDLRYATPKELPTPTYFFFLRSLVNLQELRLAGGGIHDLCDLENLSKLRRLDLTSTNVDDLEPLKSLQRLQHVELLYTAVTDLTPLTALQNLERVALPAEVSCVPLVDAKLPALREILHEYTNCL